MFTGIIEAMGEVMAVDDHDVDVRATIRADGLDFTGMKSGNSIAVNGVCLTVVNISNDHCFSADISGETLSCATFGTLHRHQRVNLERALASPFRLDGHFVSGHVDGIGEIKGIRDEGRSLRIQMELPSGLSKYIARKGSICVDGVSLTVNDRSDSGCESNIIPHTLEKTIISEYEIGTRVNIEVDLIARYLEGLINSGE